MISRADLEQTVAELLNVPPTYQTVERLAGLYTVLDHLYPTERVDTPRLGDSDFLDAVSGKDYASIMMIMDELMEATGVLNPKLYDKVMERIMEL